MKFPSPVNITRLIEIQWQTSHIIVYFIFFTTLINNLQFDSRICSHLCELHGKPFHETINEHLNELLQFLIDTKFETHYIELESFSMKTLKSTTYNIKQRVGLWSPFPFSSLRSCVYKGFSFYPEVIWTLAWKHLQRMVFIYLRQTRP